MPGCCLVSFHFLWAIHTIRPVHINTPHTSHATAKTHTSTALFIQSVGCKDEVMGYCAFISHVHSRVGNSSPVNRGKTGENVSPFHRWSSCSNSLVKLLKKPGKNQEGAHEHIAESKHYFGSNPGGTTLKCENWHFSWKVEITGACMGIIRFIDFYLRR